jgi:hypothetical protein
MVLGCSECDESLKANLNVTYGSLFSQTSPMKPSHDDITVTSLLLLWNPDVQVRPLLDYVVNQSSSVHMFAT